MNTYIRKRQMEIEVRLNIIAPLYLKGWTEKEITKEVRRVIDRPTYNQAHADIQRLLQCWRSERLTDVDDKITMEVRRLNNVIKEAWEAWERSKEDHHERKQLQYGLPKMDEKGVRQVGITTIKAMMSDAEKRGIGDPRYLDVILRAEGQLCKLLGLDKIQLNIGTQEQGIIEIKYINSGMPCANSEEEVRQREGIE